MFNKSFKFNKLYIWLFSISIIGCSFLAVKDIELRRYDEDKLYSKRTNIQLSKDVKRIFDNRCTVCHSCYNSPCRLKLSSYDGLMRGGYKIPIYGGTNFTPLPPLRLGIDETSTKGWRKRDFYPVIDESNEDGLDKVRKSLLFNMLTLKRGAHATPTVLPEETNICPSSESEFNEFKNKHIDMGMPYGMSKLTLNEYYTIGEWIRRGAKSFESNDNAHNPKEIEVLKQWDALLNGQSIKEKLSSRYLYEHLFLAHLYFKNINNKFYSLVRSTTKYPIEIKEIKSEWPYDDPGTKIFYYRFKQIKTTIVHKNHITYELSEKKILRFKELFYDLEWNSGKLYLPSYGKNRSNPFITFMQIPAKSRYQYLLDNAYYHVKTFIRGPVCKGQLALNVIDDHFSVFFLDPDSDLFVKDSKYGLHVSDYLDIPAKGGHDNLNSLYRHYKNKQNNYTLERGKRYDEYSKNGFGLDDIWDGDGHNKSASLTIYRHFDSASVMEGFQGGYPKTVWVLDYPILERIYYNLVAGFNVYGTIAHKSGARQYMDDLRVEAEDNFLSFLPRERRQALRDSWYIGNLSQLKRKIEHPIRNLNRPTQVKFTTGYYVAEFIESVFRTRFKGNIYPKRDDLNCCEIKKINLNKIKTVIDLEDHLKQVINKPGKYVEYVPDLSLIRFKVEGKYKVYTLIRNRAHLNISFMFFEEMNLDPSNDRLNIHRDYVGSYPNRIFDIVEGEENNFFVDFVNMTESNKDHFYVKYSVDKRSDRMWEIIDWFHQDFKSRFPIESGLFDLNRLGIPF